MEQRRPIPAGPFTYAYAKQAGYTPVAIRHRLGTGEWIRLRRRVLVSRDCWTTSEPEDQHLLVAQAILMDAPAGAVLSHRSAALLHRLPTLEDEVPDEVTLTAPLPRSTRPFVTGYALRRAALPRSHRCTGGGIPSTSVPRTIIDVLRESSMESGVALVDSVLHTKRSRFEDLRSVYSWCQTWPGSRMAGRALYFADARAESPLESVARVRLHQEGLPPPQLQVPLKVGRFTYRPDFLWEAERTIGEADGLGKYTDQSVLRNEKLREDRLRDMGFEVVRMTWREIQDDPAEVADRVRAAFVRSRARR